MLQIIGETMLLATRMDRRYDTPARPPRRAPQDTETRRRAWLRISGLLM